MLLAVDPAGQNGERRLLQGWSTKFTVTRCGGKGNPFWFASSSNHDVCHLFCITFHNQPPVKPARRSPATIGGQRRMMFQIKPVR